MGCKIFRVGPDASNLGEDVMLFLCAGELVVLSEAKKRPTTNFSSEAGNLPVGIRQRRVRPSFPRPRPPSPRVAQASELGLPRVQFRQEVDHFTGGAESMRGLVLERRLVAQQMRRREGRMRQGGVRGRARRAHVDRLLPRGFVRTWPRRDEGRRPLARERESTLRSPAPRRSLRNDATASEAHRRGCEGAEAG